MVAKIPKKPQNAAIFYKPEGYTTKTTRILGRMAAGEGFLKAYVESQKGQPLYCYCDNQSEFEHFRNTVTPWLKQPSQLVFIPRSQSSRIQNVGNLYLPGPALGDFAWQRRFYNQRGYSICGVTHTIASKEAINSIANLLLAPVQPWDALVCTSNAAKTAVERILNDWGEYLGQKFNTTVKFNFQLPVIPLGVDTKTYQFNPEYRNRLRSTLNIAEDDIVILFFGRLIFYAKAHPVPMYLAVEKAVNSASFKNKIHLIQCGWFEEQREEIAFKESAIQFAPSVNHIFLDGRNPGIRQQIWSAADIFISLSDNIQETFGLTPIEAMACGLPVVVSDWDGYKDTVRHEIDGFRISTIIPPEDYFLNFAHDYHIDAINYSMFIAYSCFATMVDIEECASALAKLIENPDLRRKMGENGRKRAEEIYDWQNVINRYRDLWEQLEEIRNINEMSVPVRNNSRANPLCDDPFHLFSHYSSQRLHPETRLRLGNNARESLQKIRKIWITSFGENTRFKNEIVDDILNQFSEKPTIELDYFLRVYGENIAPILYRTIMYLLKFGILEVERDSSDK
ncbi:MAG: glycosyltransferase family 4 protein [Geminocystis sp.]|nr:glycosyltransferase family 4 protein [Geminocystis sp.]